MARFYEPLLGSLLADMRGQIVNVCQQWGACRVLDVCCGAGGLTRLMCHAGMEVCGLDVSWPMLQQARKHCAVQRAGAGSPPLSHLAPLFIRADATALPFLPTLATPCPPVSATSFAPISSPLFDVAIMALALHTMPPAIGQAVVAQMLRVARYCVVADYRLAERNCDVPAAALGRAVEWLVGGEHYACYRAFMTGGGIEGFAHSQGYSPIERHRILGGAGAIIVLKAEA